MRELVMGAEMVLSQTIKDTLRVTKVSHRQIFLLKEQVKMVLLERQKGQVGFQ